MSEKHSRGLRLAGLMMSIGVLSACSQMQNDSLFTDVQSSTCPPGCVDSLKADDSQVVIKILNSTIQLNTRYSKLGALLYRETRADIGGECYTSLYTNNRIFVKVYSGSNLVSPTPSYAGVNDVAGVARCINGRFSISVDFSGVSNPGTYLVEAQLVAYDANGAQHVNQSEGISNVTVRMSTFTETQ